MLQENITPELEKKRQDLSTYVDSMLKDIAHEAKLDVLPLMVEYVQLADDLTSYSIASNHYKPLPIQAELNIYEAAVEAIFNKYIK